MDLASRTRLFKELKDIRKEAKKDDDIELICDENNIYRWTAFLKGPVDTPFYGGIFQVSINVPTAYPMEPPKVKFVTKIFHPNIHFKDGDVCLDILKTEWSPAWTLQSVCRAILTLLVHPEPDSPLNCDSGNMLRANDRRAYNSMAQMYTQLLAAKK